MLEDDPTGLTTSGSLKYTVRYASPELLMEGRARHTLMTDVWAWACLLLDVGVLDLLPYQLGASLNVDSLTDRYGLTTLRHVYRPLGGARHCSKQAARRLLPNPGSRLHPHDPKEVLEQRPSC